MSDYSPEIFVAVVGADEWRRYKGCVVTNGVPVPCSHFHKSSDAARTCAKASVAETRRRLDRMAALRIKADESVGNES